MNAAFDGTDLFYAFTTSSLQFYSNGLHDADIVRIPLNSYPFFPKETVINLREILQVTQARLEARYSNGELRFEGELSSPHISEVDRKIRTSRLLSPRMKNRILP